MSRKTKIKPLTAKQLADMDYKHEAKKAAAIKDRGVEQVTATVTGPSKAEQAAYELLGKSEHFMVGTAVNVSGVMKDTYAFGRMAGKEQGFAEGLAAPRNAAEAHAKALRPAIGTVLQEVFVELQKAYTKFGAQQASPHEGYAVLQEEVDELWDEIKADRGRLGPARKEAIQVAAMAVRYVLDNNPR